jgi:hypothetical protein
MVRVDDYPGPRVIRRGGSGMGGWIWVAPGIREPGPADVTDPAFLDKESQGAATDRDEADRGSAVLVKVVARQPAEVDESSPLAPAVDESPTVRIKVFGPVGFDPLLKVPLRNKAIETACYLALHRRRPVTTEELQIALSSDDDGPEISAKSVHNYVSELRHSLGAIHLPSARGSSGYRFADSVTCDWDEIQELAALAARDPSADLDDQVLPLGRALELMKGHPFEGTHYRWVDSELLVSAMELAVCDIARRLEVIARANGLPEVLYAAGRRTASVCPYDLGLWEMALEGAVGLDAEELAKTWHDAQVALGDEVGALGDLARRLGLL